MEQDASAAAFDNVLCQSGQFGFFQKRLFLIATLIQSACVSVLLYTSTCMPDVDELDDACAENHVTVVENGFGSSNEYNITNSTSYIINMTAAAAGASSFVNTTLFNSNTTSLLAAERIDVVAHNLTSSSESKYGYPGDTGSLNISSAFNDTTSHTLETIIPYSSTSSWTPTTSSTKNLLTTVASATISRQVNLTFSGFQNSSSQLSPISTTLEYLLQNIANITAEVNSATFGLPNVSRSPNEDLSGSGMITKEEYEPSTDIFTSERATLPFQLGSATERATTQDVRTGSLLTTTIKPSQPPTGSLAAIHNNLAATFFDILNSSASHRDNKLPGYKPTLVSLLETTPSGLNSSSTTATTPLDCSRKLRLFSTELQKTQILQRLDVDGLVKVAVFAQSAAMIVGACVGSMVADMYGRRRLLFSSLAAMLVFHCLVAVSVSWLMFIVLRALAVGCAGATLVVSFVLVIEFLGPDWRDACTCSCLWVLGAVVMSVQTLVTVHWRWLALLSGGICLPLLAAFFTSSESVRWLQCQQRFPEAENGLREVVSVNAATVTNIMRLLDQARACIVNNMHYKRFTFLDLFHSLASTRWTLTLVYTGTVTSCVYWCLLGRVRQITGVVAIDGFLPFFVDLPLTWSVIVVNRCLGRRWCLFLYSVASSFSLICVLVLHITGNLAHMPSLVTGLALFGKVGVTASLSLVLLVAIEMYPTVTRCMGFAVAVSSCSVGLMLSYTLDFLEKYHYTVPFVVYGAMLASVGAVGLFFPETMHRSLNNVQQCHHRKIPLQEGARLVGRPSNLWDDC